MSETRLVVTLSESDYADVVWFAKRRHQTLDEFVGTTLRAAMPANISTLRDSLTTQEIVAEQLEKMSAASDKLEDAGQVAAPPVPLQEGDVSVSPASAASSIVPQLPADVKQVQQERKTQGLRMVPHSCYHYVPSPRPTVMSNGVCNNEAQRGRPCDWPSGAAHDCTMFEAKRSGHSMAG